MTFEKNWHIITTIINAVKETLIRECNRETASQTESAVCGKGKGNTPEQAA